MTTALPKISASHEPDVLTESQYGRFFDLSPDLLCVAGLDGYFKQLNRCFQQVLGYTKEELLTTPFLNLVHPDDLEATAAATTQLASGKDITCFENRNRCSDGSYRWIQWNATSVSGTQLIYCIGRDITIEKQAAEELRISRERFDLAARGAIDGIWDWNIETSEDYFSDRWCEMLGYQPGELDPYFETWATSLHPEDKDRVFEAVRLHLEERVPYDLEYRMHHKSGEYHWYRASGQASWDEAGKPRRMAGSITDITENKRAEEKFKQILAELARSEEKFRLVMESSPNAKVVVNQQGHITLVNAELERLFGYAREDLIGQPIEMLIPEESRGQHHASRNSFLANPQKRAMGAGRDLLVQRKDGSRFPAEIGLNPVATSEGTFVLAAVIDLTERKRTEIELRDLAAELTRSNDDRRCCTN